MSTNAFLPAPGDLKRVLKETTKVGQQALLEKKWADVRRTLLNAAEAGCDTVEFDVSAKISNGIVQLLKEEGIRVSTITSGVYSEATHEKIVIMTVSW